MKHRWLEHEGGKPFRETAETPVAARCRRRTGMGASLVNVRPPRNVDAELRDLRDRAMMALLRRTAPIGRRAGSRPLPDDLRLTPSCKVAAWIATAVAGWAVLAGAVGLLSRLA